MPLKNAGEKLTESLENLLKSEITPLQNAIGEFVAEMKPEKRLNFLISFGRLIHDVNYTDDYGVTLRKIKFKDRGY